MLIIAGPTGVGKSSLALAVATASGSEIVSADSRQIYRGLDIGTASPTPEDRSAVPHHLVDLLEPGASYSAGQFLDDARAAILDIQSRGHPVVVVGGSTLYVHTLVGGLADLPSLDPNLVRRLSTLAETPEGRRRLFEELVARDPAAAGTLDETKSHRLIRLVGLMRETGRKPSELWEDHAVPGIPHRLVVLDRPRAELYGRIDRRVEQMVQEGLLNEVMSLLKAGPAVRTLLDATIGYRELVAHLDDDLSFDRAIALIQRNSRRYAKRQITWYKRYDHAVWLDARTVTPEDLL